MSRFPLSSGEQTERPRFTVFVRLPFPRGEFQDPPPVSWDAGKERMLWKVLSQASGDGELDWDELARAFDVSLPFLLRQAAWLYERQLSQVKAQMRKVGKSGSSAVASPAPGAPPSTDQSGGYAMKRAGSGTTMPRVPSAVSVRSRDGPLGKGEASVSNSPTNPIAPLKSRDSSATTIHARSIMPPSPRPQHHGFAARPAHQRAVKADAVPPPLSELSGVASKDVVPLSEPPVDSSESSDDLGKESTMLKSQAFKRPPRFLGSKVANGAYGLGLRDSDDDDDDDDDEDEDDDDSPAFLPAAATETQPIAGPSTPSERNIRPLPPSRHTEPNPAAFLQATQRRRPQAVHAPTAPGVPQVPPSVASSSSDAGRVLQQRQQRARGLASPRRTGELQGRSPGHRSGMPGNTIGKPGSDGTPSMGSSFSDLDDTSVTQSALEEALLSNMQHGGAAGGMASRMSTISQAFRSRYL